MSVNNIIFKEILKKGYKLEGKTRIWDLSDSKLWYLTPKQSKKYFDAEDDTEYKKYVIDAEVNLIKNNLNFILSKMKAKSYNIIDFGCGNGKKASLFIEEFSKHLNVRYCPIDISPYMVKTASENIRALNIADVFESKWNISSFENLENINSIFRDSSYKNHLILFLGSTMGNFNFNYILELIKKSMKKGDFLLIGNGIISTVTDDLISAYNDKAAINFWIQLMFLLGFKKNEVKYSVKFRNLRIEAYFTLLKDKKIKHNNEIIDFKQGDQVLVGISYKYTKDKFKKILSSFFTKVEISIDKNNTFALALCTL